MHQPAQADAASQEQQFEPEQLGLVQDSTAGVFTGGYEGCCGAVVCWCQAQPGRKAHAASQLDNSGQCCLACFASVAAAGLVQPGTVAFGVIISSKVFCCQGAVIIT